MMTLEITHQEQYSRGELLLRTLFGFFYIILPHAFVLMFVGIAAAVLNFLAFWAILFTGQYPRSMFEFVMGYLRWNQRVSLYLAFMTRAYPPFTGEPDTKIDEPKS